MEVVTPTEQLAHAAVGRAGTPIQAYCDLLEVRWLLSEKAGHDVGTSRALAALAREAIPADSAAKLAIAEVPTQPFAVLSMDDETTRTTRRRAARRDSAPYGRSGLTPDGAWVKICDELGPAVGVHRGLITRAVGHQILRDRHPPSAPREAPPHPGAVPPARAFPRGEAYAGHTGLVDRCGRVKLTNPDKVLYPATGTTKAEIFDYYVAIADVMVPHIAGRPVTRKRWPNGVGQPDVLREAAGLVGAGLAGPRLASTHKSGTTTYPIIDSREGLAWIAQQASLEVHVPQWRFVDRVDAEPERTRDPHRVRPRPRRGRDVPPAVRGRPRGPRTSSPTSG